MAEYDAECEANEPKLTPEEETEKEKINQKELEEWRKHDDQMLEWNIRQLKDERNRKKKEGKVPENERGAVKTNYYIKANHQRRL